MSKQSLLRRLSGAAPVADPAPDHKPAALTSAEVARRLEAARAEVTELERKRREIGIAVETGAPHSGESLSDAIQAVNAAREHVTTLEGVAEEIRAREQEAERIAKIALWDSRAAAFRKHLSEQEADSQTLADALAKGMTAYRRMIDRIDRIRAAHPDNSPPQWVLAEFSKLPLAVTEEFDRLWKDPKASEQQRFPGCSRHLLGQLYDERKIRPLVDRTREACAYAVKQLKRP